MVAVLCRMFAKFKSTTCVHMSDGLHVRAATEAATTVTWATFPKTTIALLATMTTNTLDSRRECVTT